MHFLRSLEFGRIVFQFFLIFRVFVGLMAGWLCQPGRIFWRKPATLWPAGLGRTDRTELSEVLGVAKAGAGRGSNFWL